MLFQEVNKNHIINVAKFELLKLKKEKKFYAAIIVSISLSVLFVVIPEIFNLESPTSVNSYFQVPLNFIFFILIICAAFFGSNSLLTDFYSKTGYLIFTKPTSKINFWVGKFLAAELISILVIVAYYLVISFGALYKFQALSIEVGTSFLFSFLVLTTLMSIAFFISSIFRGPTGASVFLFVLFILVLPIIDLVSVGIGDITPWYSIVFSSKIINLVLTEEYSQINNELIFQELDYSKFFPDFTISVGILFGYIFCAAVSSIFLYNRKEMH